MVAFYHHLISVLSAKGAERASAEQREARRALVNARNGREA